MNHGDNLARRLRPGLVLLTGLCWLPVPGYPDAVGNTVGHVVFARGQVAARTGESGSNPARLLGQNSAIFAADVVETGIDSFAVIEFIDKARMTVRPDTRFHIGQYRRDGQAEARIHLDQGGIQTTPGSIAASHPDRVEIETPLATLKPGDAEFTARLCGNNDCKAATVPEASPHAARVIALKGMVLAINRDGERSLQLGAAIDTDDRIKTLQQSYAVLLFRDGGKISLEPVSEFLIAEYHYQPDRNDNKSVINVLSGGLRALTGAIGRDNHRNYQITTPVATIGIRGTGFDLYCQGTCTASGTDRSAGLYSYVWKDSITLTNQSGTYTLDENRAGYIATADSPAIALPQLPLQFTRNPAPRPDGVTLPPGANKTATKGLYVTVQNRNGRVQVQDRTGKTTTITATSGGFVSDRGLMQAGLPDGQTPQADRLPAPATPLSTLERDYSNWSEDAAATDATNNDNAGCEVQ